MARRTGSLLLVAAIAAVGASWRGSYRPALAQEARLDAKGGVEAKEALRLFRQGLYEDAAKFYAKLSVDYPDVLLFERNLGECYYYLRRPEPAISNLRYYLSHKLDVAKDDKEDVERWIAEMERLREQTAAARPAAPPPPSQPASSPTVVVAPAPAWTATPAPSLPTSQSPYPNPVAQSFYSPTVPRPAYPAPGVQSAPPPGLWPPAPSATGAAASPAPATAPAALDLSTQRHPDVAQERTSPFYETWWFWTATVVVAGGAVTAYLLATRSGSEDPCSGSDITCKPIR
jgi:hypothetical protein